MCYSSPPLPDPGLEAEAGPTKEETVDQLIVWAGPLAEIGENGGPYRDPRKNSTFASGA